MERDFMGAAGNEQQQRQRAAEDDGTRKESAYFGAGGPPPMDWSFASRAGAAPAVMSFRQSAPREEQQQGLAHFSTFDGVHKQQASRVLTQQRSFGAENHGSPQYTATRGAYGVPPPQQQHVVNGSPYGGQTPQQQQQQQHVVNGSAYGGQTPQQQQRQHVVNGAYGGHPSQQQHAANGARATPVSSPLNPNNQMFKVQSSPNLPNGAAAGGQFKQPPFAVNNAAVTGSRVGVYARNMPKPKMAQLTIFYAGSVNVFNNVSPEKAQELMVLASRGSLPSAPSTVARSPDANLFASRGSLQSSPSTVARSPDANLFTSRGSLPSAATTVTRSPDANLFASTGSLPSAPTTTTHCPDANLFAPAKVIAPEVSPTEQMLPQMQQHVSPPVPAISKPISSVSQAPCLPKSASSSNIDSTVPKSVMPLRSQPPSTHPLTLAATTAAAIMPRAVPQARKASLARFLEKRKERVTTVAPYSSGKSPMESNDTVGSSIENNKSSLTGITISSNREKSVWRPRNISFSGECPSTNLHI
uniref:Uncharacterized protein n=2 Tax=Avena sativa TaxID=4498 RepID=A0ACD5Y5K2_AVESA